MSPRDRATRAEIAAMLARAAEVFGKAAIRALELEDAKAGVSLLRWCDDAANRSLRAALEVREGQP